MSYRRYEPVDPRDAFTIAPKPDSEATESAAASQAALLLLARAGVLGMGADAGLAESEKADPRFQLPDLEPLRRSRRLRVDEATQPLGVSSKELGQEEAPQLQDEMARAVRELYEHPSTESAAALFEASMYSEHPLVRVAAAAGARETTRLRKQIRQTLEAGCDSEDPLVADVSREAIRQIDPRDPYLQSRIVETPPSEKRAGRSSTAVITHGTFAASSVWYRPGGDFYEALADRRPDLHLHDESFTWSGSYSHNARRADAAALEQWLLDEGLHQPDVFAHSHGGTVANLATRRGVELERLVLLAWPVHQQWSPDFTRVGRVIDVRVRFDLVILVDGGRQRFRSDEFDVEEHRHGWFDHSAPHDPAYWDDHGLWNRL